MGYVDYFLIVWDFIHYAKSHGIPVGPGRGSGAGSIVAYCLGITGIDPMKYNLLFERFLNPERVSPCPISTLTSATSAGRRSSTMWSGKYGSGPRGPDHHLRHHGGQGRHPGCGPGHGHELSAAVDQVAKAHPLLDWT